MSPRLGPGTVTPAELVVVDLDGEISGSARPPLELPVHTSVYREIPEVGAICRIHGEAASVLSVLRIHVRPLHFLGSILGGEVPVHDYGDLITDDARGVAVARALRGQRALLLRGNGQVVVGRTLAEACVRAIYLEEAARLQAQAMALGEPRYYTAEEVAEYAHAWEDPVNVQRAWNFYVGLVGPQRSTSGS